MFHFRMFDKVHQFRPCGKFHYECGFRSTVATDTTVDLNSCPSNTYLLALMLYLAQAIRREAPRIGGSFAIWGGLFSTFDCTLVAIRKKVCLCLQGLSVALIFLCFRSTAIQVRKLLNSTNKVFSFWEWLVVQFPYCCRTLLMTLASYA